MKMIKCLSVLLVSFLFLMTGCAPKVITNISKSYPASVTADKVRLYELGEAVPASAERIGNVSVVDNGVSTKCNYDQVVWLANAFSVGHGGVSGRSSIESVGFGGRGCRGEVFI